MSAGDLFTRLQAALADRYAVERELGSGGMATVYLAEDLKHRRRVAVKVLRPELAASIGAERFLVNVRVRFPFWGHSHWSLSPSDTPSSSAASASSTSPSATATRRNATTASSSTSGRTPIPSCSRRWTRRGRQWRG